MDLWGMRLLGICQKKTVGIIQIYNRKSARHLLEIIKRNTIVVGVISHHYTTDEDNIPMDTNNTPQVDIQGPITHARAQ
jgi:hypothetical protein